MKSHLVLAAAIWCLPTAGGMSIDTGSAVLPARASVAEAVGHCVTVDAVYVLGQQVTDTYEACVPV